MLFWGWRGGCDTRITLYLNWSVLNSLSNNSSFSIDSVHKWMEREVSRKKCQPANSVFVLKGAFSVILSTVRIRWELSSNLYLCMYKIEESVWGWNIVSVSSHSWHCGRNLMLLWLLASDALYLFDDGTHSLFIFNCLTVVFLYIFFVQTWG